MHPTISSRCGVLIALAACALIAPQAASQEQRKKASEVVSRRYYVVWQSRGNWPKDWVEIITEMSPEVGLSCVGTKLADPSRGDNAFSLNRDMEAVPQWLTQLYKAELSQQLIVLTVCGTKDGKLVRYQHFLVAGYGFPTEGRHALPDRIRDYLKNAKEAAGWEWVNASDQPTARKVRGFDREVFFTGVNPPEEKTTVSKDNQLAVRRSESASEGFALSNDSPTAQRKSEAQRRLERVGVPEPATELDAQQKQDSPMYLPPDGFTKIWEREGILGILKQLFAAVLAAIALLVSGVIGIAFLSSLGGVVGILLLALFLKKR